VNGIIDCRGTIETGCLRLDIKLAKHKERVLLIGNVGMPLSLALIRPVRCLVATSPCCKLGRIFSNLMWLQMHNYDRFLQLLLALLNVQPRRRLSWHMGHDNSMDAFRATYNGIARFFVKYAPLISIAYPWSTARLIHLA
jgi:hypothetical protein